MDNHNNCDAKNCKLYGNIIKIIGNGSFSTVHSTTKNFAVKCYIDKDDGMLNMIREVSVLRYLQHPNIVNIIGICKNKVYMEQAYTTLNKINSFPNEKRTPDWYIYQLLKAIEYCHYNKVIHRDIKPQNVLIYKDKVVLADFGLARPFYLYTQVYTSCVCTMPWRPPEILLGQSKYSYSIDIWSIGIIFFQLLETNYDHFRYYEDEQLHSIFYLLGSPTENNWPGVTKLPKWNNKYGKYTENNLYKYVQSTQESDLLQLMLDWEPNRISAKDALTHQYFDKIKPHTIDNKLAVKDQQLKIIPTELSEPRKITLSWLWQVIGEFDFDYNTLFIAINIFDKFISTKKNINIDDIQGYTIMCLNIAVKINEITIMEFHDIIEYTVGLYTEDQLLFFENDILETLNYDILETPYSLFITSECKDKLLYLVKLVLNHEWINNWKQEDFIKVVNNYCDTNNDIILYTTDKIYTRRFLTNYFNNTVLV